MPCVEVSEKIKGINAHRVYQVIKDMERYPLFMPNLISVNVLQREENATITEWKSKANGMDFSWVEKDVFDDQRMTIDYTQIEGNLKKLTGRWTVCEAAGEVLVKLQVDFDLGVPMLAEMIHPLLQKTIYENCVKMVLGIKKELCESIASP